MKTLATSTKTKLAHLFKVLTHFIKVSGEEVKIGTVLFDYDKKSNDGISLRKNEKVMVSNKTF